MKKLSLSLCFLIALASGCGNLPPRQLVRIDAEGPHNLEWPRGDKPLETKLTIKNISEGMVYVGLRRGGTDLLYRNDLYEIKPDSALVFTDETNATVTVEVYASREGLQDKLGHSAAVFSFEWQCLYDETVLIDESMVRHRAKWQIGVVANINPLQTLDYSDTRGNAFTLRPHEAVVLYAPAGPYTAYWWPHGTKDDERQRREHRIIIDQILNYQYVVNGQAMDFAWWVVIHDIGHN